jgi:uncharacterized membrane protein YgdD (TMEM256/DUF423 family)
MTVPFRIEDTEPRLPKGRQGMYFEQGRGWLAYCHCPRCGTRLHQQEPCECAERGGLSFRIGSVLIYGFIYSLAGLSLALCWWASPTLAVLMMVWWMLAYAAGDPGDRR